MTQEGVVLGDLIKVRPLWCEFDLFVPILGQESYLSPGHRLFSKSLFGTAAKNADVVLDVGAGFGYFSLVAAKSGSKGSIFAYEESSETRLILQSNFDLEKLPNLQVIEPELLMLDDLFTNTRVELSDEDAGHLGKESEINDLANSSQIPYLIDEKSRVLINVNLPGRELVALKRIHKSLHAASSTTFLIQLEEGRSNQGRNQLRELLQWLSEYGLRVFLIDNLGYRWEELSDYGRIEKVDLSNYGLWCVPRNGSVSVSVVLHSSGIAGAELVQIENIENVVSRGGMVHTILPSPDFGLGELAKRAGSSVSIVENYPWWIQSAESTEMASEIQSRKPGIASSQVVDEISKVDPDVIMTQTVVILQGAMAALILSKPHVWSIQEFADRDHGLYARLEPKEMGLLVSSLSNIVLTNSVAVRKHFFPQDEELAKVLYPRPKIRADTVRPSRLGKRWTLGVVGNLQVGKGHADAIKAISELLKEDIIVDLICVGHGSKSDLERLNELVTELNVTGQVSFLGHLPDRSLIYEKFDAVAVTSRNEAFGRVPFEATEFGLPVIYANSGGMVEYMIPGKTGIVYSPGDVGDLVGAIRSLVSDGTLGQKLVTNARKHFIDFESSLINQTSLFEYLNDAKNAKFEADAKTALRWLSQLMVAERDGLVAERERIFTSTSWRLTRPIRFIKALMNGFGARS